MSDFQFICLYNKFSAVPIRSGRLKSEPIGNQCDEEYAPAHQVVDEVVSAATLDRA